MNKLNMLILAAMAMLCLDVLAQTKRTEKTQDLQEVVVTGTGTHHLLKNAPVQTEVITRKMLDSYAGKSIEDILGGLTASFAFAEGDMGSQMQLNGLGNNYILILIDGKRLHGDNGGENDLGLIDPHNIERIEIVKGAQSALYGSDAMAGVVNIITKKTHFSDDSFGLSLDNSTRYATHNDLRQHDGIGLKLGKLQSSTLFQYQHSDGWQNTSREYTEGMVVEDSRKFTSNKFSNWQIAQKFTYDFSPRLSAYADGSYYRKIINRPTNGRYASCDVYTYDLMYRNASASIGGKYLLGKLQKSQLSQDYVSFDLDWDKHAYYYKYTARTYEHMFLRGDEFGEQQGEWFSVPYYKGQKNLQSDQQRIMATAKTVLHLPYANTLNAGAEYRYDYLDAPNRTASGSESDWTAALYAQDEFNLLSWLNVTAGLRLVENANSGVRLTPKVSTMLSCGDFRFRLGWSQGFKSPTVKELYYRYLHVMGSSTFFNLGNEKLKPQTSDYLSANIEYRGNRLTASVTAYLNNLDNMIALVNVPVSEIPAGITTAYLGDGSSKVTARMYKNMEDARTSGLDVNLSYKFTEELSVMGNYSYLDTKAHVFDNDRNRLREAVIDGMAHHKWNATAVYTHRFATDYKLGVNLSARGSSRRTYENNGDGKAFQLWRLTTTHDLPSWKGFAPRLEVGVDNIFNYCDTTMHPYHLGTNSSGTTVFATLTLRFNHGKKLSKESIIKSKRENNEDD